MKRHLDKTAWPGEPTSSIRHNNSSNSLHLSIRYIYLFIHDIYPDAYGPNTWALSRALHRHRRITEPYFHRQPPFPLDPIPAISYSVPFAAFSPLLLLPSSRMVPLCRARVSRLSPLASPQPHFFPSIPPIGIRFCAVTIRNDAPCNCHSARAFPIMTVIFI